MLKGFFEVPKVTNEKVRLYEPGSKDRERLKQALEDFRKIETEIPMIIGGKEVLSGNRIAIHPPHEHRKVLGYYHEGSESHVHEAIGNSLRAKAEWEQTSWEHRAAIFLRAADLIATTYRYKINAATMLGQSKNAYQAEIDAACELTDFLRYNVLFMTELYRQQPVSPDGAWNRMEYRALEGFVYAITPFNFTAISGNLPASAALMGNVVLWKPSDKQIYSAHIIMQAFREAGLPPGVINMVFVDPAVCSNIALSHSDFAGIHFTGSTAVFKNLWRTIGNNIHLYKNFPRIVGETGGKDFMLFHSSADVPSSVATLIRGAFEYQGQKCSAASRAYISSSLWPAFKEQLIAEMASLKVGPVEDFTNFINAVIDERSFDKLAAVIEKAKHDAEVDVIYGGTCTKEIGYYIEPTLLVVKDPHYDTIQNELFGPVLTIFIFQDERFEDTLDLIDTTSSYALTGAILARDRAAISLAEQRLAHAAGNFYINDKCTGAVVGQQPFGGARASGTNDKAGSALNLTRWVSARAIKETLVPPADYRYATQLPD